MEYRCLPGIINIFVYAGALTHVRYRGFRAPPYLVLPVTGQPENFEFVIPPLCTLENPCHSSIMAQPNEAALGRAIFSYFFLPSSSKLS